MPAPRVTIAELPDQPTVLGTELLVVQDGSTTKKMTLSKVTQQDLAPRVAALESADAALATRVTQAETVNTGQDTAITTNNGRISTLETQMTDTYNALVGDDVRMDGHDTLLANHTSRLNGHDTALTTVNNKVTTNTGDITSLDTRVDAIEAMPPSGSPIRRQVTLMPTTTVFVGASLENRMYALTATGAVTVTVPDDVSVPCPIGMEMDILWWGTAPSVTFVAAAGASIQGTPGLKLRARYSAATVKKIDANAWVVMGDLQA